MSKPSDTTAGDSGTGDRTSETVSTNAEKDPKEWVTGGEPMTGPQQSYLNTLAQEAEVEVPDDLTKADASTMIDELQDKTGRGK
jgi:hypothetical protein